MSERDLVGYGGCPPHPRWPNDARVAVQFVLNIEEGAESSILKDGRTVIDGRQDRRNSGRHA